MFKVKQQYLRNDFCFIDYNGAIRLVRVFQATYERTPKFPGIDAINYLIASVRLAYLGLNTESGRDTYPCK